MVSTADEENHGEVHLLQIDVGQLLTERVVIGKEHPTTPTDAVIDTGAAVSIIAPKLAAEMGLELKACGGPSIVMVNGQRTPPLGRVQIKITIGETTAEADVLVLEMRGIDLLLGNDVLRQFKKLEIEYGAGKPKMRFGDLPVSIIVEHKKETASKLVARKGTRIPAKSWAAVEVEQTEASRPTTDGRPWMIEPTRKRQAGPTPGRALMPGDRQTTWILMLNMESRPVYVHKKNGTGAPDGNGRGGSRRRRHGKGRSTRQPYLHNKHGKEGTTRV
jgi:predicted aspartyl protease